MARGYTYAEIAPLVGVSENQVYRDYKAWAAKRAKRLADRQDSAFLEVLNGLDEVARRAWEEIAEPKTTAKTRRELLDTISKTLERKARLMGLVTDVRSGPQVTTNILALVHPAAAAALKTMTPEEAEEIEGEFLALPNADA